MLKEVGTSGQISLGKKYAGQLFDVQTEDDGSVVMRPFKVVPMVPTVQEALAPYAVSALTPSAYLGNREWAGAHVEDIAQYNAWAAQTEPYSQRVRRWREGADDDPRCHPST